MNAQQRGAEDIQPHGNKYYKTFFLNFIFATYFGAIVGLKIATAMFGLLIGQ